MTIRPFNAMLVLTMLSFACTEKEPEEVDSDGDGLLDSEDPAPNNPDADGDGLQDGEELDLGTDPEAADSDGDTYWDSWEINEETDPTDAESRIYTGYWPYNPDKDSLDVPTEWGDAERSADSPLTRFTMVDQFGEYIDIYDFANQGKPMLMDISAMWCGPCNGLSSWLAGDDYYGFDAYWPAVDEMIHAGDIYWITILGENNQGREASAENVADWFKDYPDETVPVLADEVGDASSFFITYGWPTVVWLNEDLTINFVPDSSGNDFYGALDAAQEYGEELGYE